MYNRKCSLNRGFIAAILAALSFFSLASAGELHDAVRASDVAGINRLLDSGADINQTDFNVGTPLHIAVFGGKVVLAKILVDRGADIEAESELGRARAVHFAATLGDPAMLRFLLDATAEIDARDDEDKTPLHRAAIHGNTDAAKLLIERGADIEAVDDRYGFTPLISAALSGRLEIVRLLIKAGANIEARDRSGRTALREAATVQSWINVGGASLIEYLVSKGADLNAREDIGFSILEWAKARASSDVNYQLVVDALLKLGALE